MSDDVARLTRERDEALTALDEARADVDALRSALVRGTYLSALGYWRRRAEGLAATLKYERSRR